MAKKKAKIKVKLNGKTIIEGKATVAKLSKYIEPVNRKPVPRTVDPDYNYMICNDCGYEYYGDSFCKDCESTNTDVINGEEM